MSWCIVVKIRSGLSERNIYEFMDDLEATYGSHIIEKIVLQEFRNRKIIRQNCSKDIIAIKQPKPEELRLKCECLIQVNMRKAWDKYQKTHLETRIMNCEQEFEECLKKDDLFSGRVELPLENGLFIKNARSALSSSKINTDANEQFSIDINEIKKKRKDVDIGSDFLHKEQFIVVRRKEIDSNELSVRNVEGEREDWSLHAIKKELSSVVGENSSIKDFTRDYLCSVYPVKEELQQEHYVSDQLIVPSSDSIINHSSESHSIAQRNAFIADPIWEGVTLNIPRKKCSTGELHKENLSSSSRSCPDFCSLGVQTQLESFGKRCCSSHIVQSSVSLDQCNYQQEGSINPIIDHGGDTDFSIIGGATSRELESNSCNFGTVECVDKIDMEKSTVINECANHYDSIMVSQKKHDKENIASDYWLDCDEGFPIDDLYESDLDSFYSGDDDTDALLIKNGSSENNNLCADTECLKPTQANSPPPRARLILKCEGCMAVTTGIRHSITHLIGHACLKEFIFSCRKCCSCSNYRKNIFKHLMRKHSFSRSHTRSMRFYKENWSQSIVIRLLETTEKCYPRYYRIIENHLKRLQIRCL